MRHQACNSLQVYPSVTLFPPKRHTFRRLSLNSALKARRDVQIGALYARRGQNFYLPIRFLLLLYGKALESGERISNLSSGRGENARASPNPRDPGSSASAERAPEHGARGADFLARGLRYHPFGVNGPAGGGSSAGEIEPI